MFDLHFDCFNEITNKLHLKPGKKRRKIQKKNYEFDHSRKLLVPFMRAYSVSADGFSIHYSFLCPGRYHI